MRKRRLTETRKVRPFRIDKRLPKRTVVESHVDYGSHEEITKFSYPQNTIIEKTFNPKQKNPNLFWLWIHPIHIIVYLDTEKGFVYDERKNYLGCFEIHDLKKLYSRIGLFFLSRKKPKG